MLLRSAIMPWAIQLVFCFTLIGKAHAQLECSVRNFNTENGLPQNSILDMTMDQDGYLWMATQTSLVRYDGSTIKSFPFTNAQQTGTDILFAINADKKTIIKSADKKTYILEKGRPVWKQEIKQTKNADVIHGYFPSVAAYNAFNDALQNHRAEKNWTTNVVNAIQINTTDIICGYENTASLFYYRNGVRVKDIAISGLLQSLLKVNNFSFVKDDQSNLYFFNSNNKSLGKVNINWSTLGGNSGQNRELAFFPDQFSKTSWCVFNDVFYGMSYDPQRNLMSFTPRFAIKDREHFWRGVIYDSASSTFFMSTLNEGLFQVRLHKMKTIAVNDSLPSGSDPASVINYSVLKTSDTTAIIPTGYEFREFASGVATRKLGNLFSTRETIAKWKDEKILTALYNNIFLYSPADGFRQKQIFNNTLEKINNSQISFLYPEGDSLWASSNEEIYLMNRDKVQTIYKHNTSDSFKQSVIRVFHRINDREVIVSNPYNTYRLQTSSPFKMTEIPALKGKQVRYVSTYKDMLVLSVYHIGLYILKDTSFYPVPVSAEQADISSCHSTYIDSEGFIWVTTNKGLFKSTIESVVDAAINKKTIPFFIYYGKEDGIDNTEFNGSGNPSYAVLRKEQILYPSMGGIVTFRPATVNRKIADKQLFVEKVIIDTTEKEITSDSITLQPDFKYLVVEISAPFYGDPRNLHLEYSFDSINWKVIPVINQKKITLSNIPAGMNRLLIRKRIGFTTSDYIYADPFFIYRKKSIYEQVWFYLLALAVLGLLYLLIVKIHTRNINRNRKRLEQKVNEQTHELSQSFEVKDLLMSIIMHDMITPLRHIGLISGILKKGLEKDPVQAEQALGDIQSTAERIMNNSNSIINWIKYNNKQIEVIKEPVNLRNAIDEVLEPYKPVARNKNIELLNEVRAAKFLELDITIFNTILDNIITNSIKYTGKGQIKIEMESPASIIKTVLKITDTGTGIVPEQFEIIQQILNGNLQALKSTNKVNTGLGYIMIAELIKLHSMNVVVKTDQGIGTTVTLTIHNDIGV